MFSLSKFGFVNFVQDENDNIFKLVYEVLNPYDLNRDLSKQY